MKTASSIPAEISLRLRLNGLSQEKLGSIEPAGAPPAYTLTSATTAKAARVTISAASSPIWVRAESSLPISTIAVTTQIQTPPTAATAAVEAAAESQPTRRKV